jgi:TRAP-type transport system small permease protein
MHSLSRSIVGAGRRLAPLPSWLAAAALFFLMVMTFCDVVLRSIFNSPIEAATELTRICMAIVVFASLPVISARGGQIVVDLLDPLFRGLAARLRDGIVDIVSGVLLIWPAQQCFKFAGRAMDYGDLTEYLGIPQFYIEYFIAVATSVTVVVLIVRGLVELFTPASMHHSEPVYRNAE